VQYRPPDPGVYIQKRSDIQTLGIIERKKKAPVKGPKFILEGLFILRLLNCEE